MSRPPIFALFLALAAASAGLCRARADAARNEAAVNAGELGDATQGIDKGEFKGAHAELEALAADPPELPGEIDLAASDRPAAIREFQSERALNPLQAAVYERLGDAYFRNRDYELARQSFDRALLLDQSSTGPCILLGKVLMKEQNSLMAVGYPQRAERMDPANYVTHYLLGQAYHATGRAEEANREFQTSERMRFGEASSPGPLR